MIALHQVNTGKDQVIKEKITKKKVNETNSSRKNS